MTQAPAFPTPAVLDAGYMSRLEHEVLMARAVREAYELHRANRRDLFIAAAVQGLMTSTKHSIADIARLSVECADAVLKADGKDE